MKSALSLVLAIAVGIISFVSPAMSAVKTCTALPLDSQFDIAISPTSVDQALFDAAVLHFVNIERCAHGLSALRSDASLQRATARHSEHMATNAYLSHKSRAPGMRDLADRLKKARVSYKVAGENIAKSFVFAFYKSPIGGNSATCDFKYAKSGAKVPVHTYASMAEDLVDMWMDSPSHRKNILYAGFRRAGATANIDASEYCGTIYAAQNFAN
ncbi:MAG TPA: CAP domain-containing protein [Paracoccaceae bacterium]|nr:CAP domain-containing protein [Paracoccaceae bacterium]